MLAPFFTQAGGHHGAAHGAKLQLHEDNTALIACIRSGRNPTMRYIGRTHRVSVAWLKEVCDTDKIALDYTASGDMAADIFTKGFAECDKWQHACQLVRIGLDKDALRAAIAVPFPPACDGGGGGQKNP